MKQHNNTRSRILAGTLSLACLSFTVIDSVAQKPGGIRKGAGKGRVVPAKRAQRKGIDIAEIGAQRDKFMAYKRLTFGGAGYYTKEDGRLRAAHVKTYMLIRNSLVEDRINEELGRNAVKELLAIGVEANSLRGEADALTSDQAKEIGQKIQTLAKRVAEARLNKVNPDTLTPRVNESQAHMEELFLFATDSKVASAGQASTLRRHLTDLEKKEDKAKSDDTVSDREREKLIEEAHDVWKYFVKVLKP